MSVANLTRYTEFLRYDGHTSAALMVESSTGAYVKFEEAVEASSNSLQQLKAEIAALVTRWDNLKSGDYPSPRAMYHDFLFEVMSKLRQLSAV